MSFLCVYMPIDTVHHRFSTKHGGAVFSSLPPLLCFVNSGTCSCIYRGVVCPLRTDKRLGLSKSSICYLLITAKASALSWDQCSCSMCWRKCSIITNLPVICSCARAPGHKLQQSLQTWTAKGDMKDTHKHTPSYAKLLKIKQVRAVWNTLQAAG